MFLLLDNYDSFTYNLYDYLCQAGAECLVWRNDAFSLDILETLPLEGIILSPGPGRPADAGLLLPLVERWHARTPMLGICLGHQAIGTFFGAPLVKAREPVHGKTSEVQHHGHPLFDGVPPRFSVMRYHSLLLSSLDGTPLEGIAYTPEGELMALAHRSLPLWGVQFHPESVLTEFGLQMLKNWLILAHEFNTATRV